MANQSSTHATASVSSDAFEKRQRMGVILTVAGPLMFLACAAAIAMSPMGTGIRLQAQPAPDMTPAHPGTTVLAKSSNSVPQLGR